MTDPIERTGLRSEFWKSIPLEKLTQPEWEALCDGCGKCCLNKIEDDISGEVFLTRVACRLFDDTSCHCSHYQGRHKYVPECIVLTPATVEQHSYWLPRTCAYLLVWQNEPLPDWHPLLTGSSDSVHQAGVSMIGQTVPEFNVDDDDWEDHIIEEPV